MPAAGNRGGQGVPTRTQVSVWVHDGFRSLCLCATTARCGKVRCLPTTLSLMRGSCATSPFEQGGKKRKGECGRKEGILVFLMRASIPVIVLFADDNYEYSFNNDDYSRVLVQLSINQYV